jgi:hypothetical protein
MKQEIIDKLKKLAEDQTWEDVSEEDKDEYFIVDDFAGGNVDDAYQGGIRTGKISLARELLISIKEEQ